MSTTAIQNDTKQETSNASCISSKKAEGQVNQHFETTPPSYIR